MAGRGGHLRHGAPRPGRFVGHAPACRCRARPVLRADAPLVRRVRRHAPRRVRRCGRSAAAVRGGDDGRCRRGRAAGGAPGRPAGGAARGLHLCADPGRAAVRAGRPLVRDGLRAGRLGQLAAGAGRRPPAPKAVARLYGADAVRLPAARVRLTRTARTRRRGDPRAAAPPGTALLAARRGHRSRRSGPARGVQHPAVGADQLAHVAGPRSAADLRRARGSRHRLHPRPDPLPRPDRTARPRPPPAAPAHPAPAAPLPCRTRLRGPLCPLLRRRVRAARGRRAGAAAAAGRGAGPDPWPAAAVDDDGGADRGGAACPSTSICAVRTAGSTMSPRSRMPYGRWPSPATDCCSCRPGGGSGGRPCRATSAGCTISPWPRARWPRTPSTAPSGPAMRSDDRMLSVRRIVVAGDPDGQPVDDNDQEIAKRTTLRDAFGICRSRRSGAPASRCTRGRGLAAGGGRRLRGTAGASASVGAARPGGAHGVSVVLRGWLPGLPWPRPRPGAAVIPLVVGGSCGPARCARRYAG